MPSVAVVIAAALCLLPACGDGGPPRSYPSYGTSLADPAVDAIRPYLDQVGATVVSVNREEGHLGLYVRPEPAWDMDRYVTQLPLAAEAARAVLARFPELTDVDLCADGPWLPHPSDAAFASASRVQVYRDRLDRLPARFAAPAEVLRAGLRGRLLDYYLDERILRESPAYAAERRKA